MATHEEINQKLAEGIFKDLSVIEAKAASLENATSDVRWGFIQGANWALACLGRAPGDIVEREGTRRFHGYGTNPLPSTSKPPPPSPPPPRNLKGNVG